MIEAELEILLIDTQRQTTIYKADFNCPWSDHVSKIFPTLSFRLGYSSLSELISSLFLSARD